MRIAPGSWLLTRYDDVLAVYRDARASSDKKREFAPKFGDSPLFEHHTSSLVFNDPPLHTRVRRLLVGALNQQAIARMEAGVVALVDGLLDRMQGLAEPDLIEDFAARIPVEVIGNLLDVPRAERAPLRGWSLAILSALEPAPGADVLARGNAAVERLQGLPGTLVAERRRRPGDPRFDVLTRLIQGEVRRRAAQRDRAAAQLHLPAQRRPRDHHQPDRQRRACAADAARAVAAPAGRPVAAGHGGRRAAALRKPAAAEQPPQHRADAHRRRASCRPAASSRWPSAAPTATRRMFHDPDRLDVGRKPNPHLAFGQGAHACAGMNVARLEARIAFGRLLARCPRPAAARHAAARPAHPLPRLAHAAGEPALSAWPRPSRT